VLVLLKGEQRDSDGRLRFQKPIGVIACNLKKIARATFVGNSSKCKRRLEKIPSKKCQYRILNLRV